MKETGVDTKEETNPGCLLFICYCNDKGCIFGRQPEALNPVFKSQFRYKVHKPFRTQRWWRSSTSHLRLLTNYL